MRVVLLNRKWQVASLVLAVALAISIGLNIYQHYNAPSNDSSGNPGSSSLTDSLGNSSSDNIIGESIILEKVFNEIFKLTMIVAKDTYALGEPILFTLKLSNICDESVVIYYAWMDLLRYQMINSSGHMIYYKTEAPGEIVLPVIVDEKLGPNMAHEKRFIWRQVYRDYYNATWPLEEDPITTLGNYTIIGQTYFYLRENGFLRIVETKLQIEIRII